MRNAKQAEYDAKAKADRDATARLLADPAASKAEIEKRLTSWITAKDEIYILEVRSSSGRQTLQTIPRSRAWSVKCTGGVLMVEFPTITADEDDAALTIRLLPGSLDAQKCREYAELVASRMAELTHAR